MKNDRLSRFKRIQKDPLCLENESRVRWNYTSLVRWNEILSMIHPVICHRYSNFIFVPSLLRHCRVYSGDLIISRCRQTIWKFSSDRLIYCHDTSNFIFMFYRVTRIYTNFFCKKILFGKNSLEVNYTEENFWYEIEVFICFSIYLFIRSRKSRFEKRRFEKIKACTRSTSALTK